MKSILFVLSSLHRNGTETALMNLFNNLPKNKYSVDFLIFDNKNMDYETEILNAGSRIFFISKRRLGILRYIREVKSFFKNNCKNYDIIHFNFCYLSTYALFYYAKKYSLSSTKRIIHSHSSSHFGSVLIHMFHIILRKQVVKMTTHHIACSSEAANWFYHGTRAQGSYTVIPNGISFDKFYYNHDIRHNIREQLNILNDVFVFGHVGYFSAVKNHKFLIKIFSIIASHLHNSILLLIGEGGELQHEIVSLINSSEFKNRIIMLGRRDDIAHIYQAIDFIIFPSLFEGLPMTLLEAQAAGLRIIASNSISKEVKFTDNCYFMSLEERDNQWAEFILSKIHYSRKVMKEECNKSKFNIKNSSIKFQAIYDS